VDACSLWEFAAATAGWSKANGGESKPEAPTDDEHDELVEKYAHI